MQGGVSHSHSPHTALPTQLSIPGPQPGSFSSSCCSLSCPAAPQQLWGWSCLQPRTQSPHRHGGMAVELWDSGRAMGQWHGHAAELHGMGQTPGSSLKPPCRAAPLFPTAGPLAAPQHGQGWEHPSVCTPHTHTHTQPGAAHCQHNPQPRCVPGLQWQRDSPPRLSPAPLTPSPTCLGVSPGVQRQLCPCRVARGSLLPVTAWRCLEPAAPAQSSAGRGSRCQPP